MAIQGYYREKHIRPAITPMVDKSESAVAMRKKREHNTHTPKRLAIQNLCIARNANDDFTMKQNTK